MKRCLSIAAFSVRAKTEFVFSPMYALIELASQSLGVRKGSSLFRLERNEHAITIGFYFGTSYDVGF